MERLESGSGELYNLFISCTETKKQFLLVQLIKQNLSIKKYSEEIFKESMQSVNGNKEEKEAFLSIISKSIKSFDEKYSELWDKDNKPDEGLVFFEKARLLSAIMELLKDEYNESLYELLMLYEKPETLIEQFYEIYRQ